MLLLFNLVLSHKIIHKLSITLCNNKLANTSISPSNKICNKPAHKHKKTVQKNTGRSEVY